MGRINVLQQILVLFSHACDASRNRVSVLEDILQKVVVCFLHQQLIQLFDLGRRLSKIFLKVVDLLRDFVIRRDSVGSLYLGQLFVEFELGFSCLVSSTGIFGIFDRKI